MKKLKTKFEAFNDEDVTNKAYLNKRITKIEGQISYRKRLQ